MSREWAAKQGRLSTLRKTTAVKRCRDCQAPVLWVERGNGWHVKLDAHPVSGGAWGIKPDGLAWPVDRKHANHGRYNKHVCEAS